MVGVAGRSKGCKTCRKRKVACSLERPQCKVCTKSNRECGGYHREIVFVFDSGIKKETSRPKNRMLAKSPQKVPPPKEQQIVSAPKDVHSTTFNETALATVSPLPIHDLSSRAIYRDQLLAECVYSFIPSAYSSSWLRTLPSHSVFTSALETSALAVCFAELGRLKGSSTLAHRSLKFYVQALWELQKALWDEDLMYSDETLAACMLLITYEMKQRPEKTAGAWIGHMDGCAKLVEIRGPDSFKTEFGLELYSSFRQVEIHRAVNHRRKSFLLGPEWRFNPWKHHPKPITQELLDIELDIANNIEFVYSNISRTSPEEFVFGLLETIEAAWALDLRLRKFHEKFEAQMNGGPLYWPQVSNGFNSKIKSSMDPEIPIFPVAFQFLDLGTAHTCMLYWALLSILWSCMTKLYASLEEIQSQIQSKGQITATSLVRKPSLSPEPPTHDENPSSPPLLADEVDLTLFSRVPPLGHRLDYSLPARHICQSLEFCSHASRGTISAPASILPLKVAIEAFAESGCLRELGWARAAFAVVGTKGTDILRQLEYDAKRNSYLP